MSLTPRKNKNQKKIFLIYNLTLDELLIYATHILCYEYIDWAKFSEQKKPSECTVSPPTSGVGTIKSNQLLVKTIKNTRGKNVSSPNKVLIKTLSSNNSEDITKNFLFFFLLVDWKSFPDFECK